VNVRPLRAQDAETLSRFTCSDGADEVQDFFRADAASYTRTPNCYVRVLVDARDELVGACAFEFDESAEDGYEWFVKAIAIQLEHQAQMHATALLQTCLAEMAERTPRGSAAWHVEVKNLASQRMSDRVGAEWTKPPGYNTLLLYYVSFESN
jgi:RimJ/RimL family protein N-acetyltransferase